MATFNIKQNDTSPAIQYALTPVSVVLTGATVVFNMKARGSNTVPVISRAAASIVTATGTPTVKYDWQEGDTALFGNYVAEFEVTYLDGTVETFPNDSWIDVSIYPDIA